MTKVPDRLAESVAGALRGGEPITDAEFDRLLPPGPRDKSARFWSSVAVARTAAEWLFECGAQRVLDVGCGVGKFCAIASLSSGHRIWGLEKRGTLVFEARKLAQRLGAEVVVIEGLMASLRPTEFDGFYVFNPFAEHLGGLNERFDDQIVPSRERYLRHARTLERWLDEVRPGTTLVTYNGLGGRIPSSWECVRRQMVRGNLLRLWRKGTERAEPRNAWVEVNDVLLRAEALKALVQRHPHASVDEVLVLAQLLDEA